MDNILLPHSDELEISLIGAAMHSKEAAEIISDMDPNCFHDAANRTIANDISTLFKRGIAVDIKTLKNSLERSGKLLSIGGSYKIVEASSNYNFTNNYREYARVLEGLHASRILANSMDGWREDLLLNAIPVNNLIERIETTCFRITQKSDDRKVHEISEIAISYLDSLEARMNNNGLNGIPSGIPSLDLMTGGFEEPELCIIGARPSMGKTDLGLFIAYTAAKRFKHKTGFISFEMSEKQLFGRLMALESGLSKADFKNADRQKLTLGTGSMRKEVLTAAGVIAKSGLVIHDMGSAGFPELKRVCRRLVKGGCELIVIDYLGLINLNRSNGRSKSEALGEITRGMKMQIAKGMKVPVIALHQLSRSCETRGGDRRPILSDLRDSGEIEQDADRVVFIYRPEYYGFETDDEGNTTKGLCELIIAKNREGPTGTVKLQYSGSIGDYKDWNHGVMETYSQPGGNTIVIPAPKQNIAPF